VRDRFGSIASVLGYSPNVRLSPNSDRIADMLASLFVPIDGVIGRQLVDS